MSKVWQIAFLIQLSVLSQNIRETSKWCLSKTCTEPIFESTAIRDYSNTDPTFLQIKEGMPLKIIAFMFSNRVDLMKAMTLDGKKGMVYISHIDQKPLLNHLKSSIELNRTYLSVVNEDNPAQLKTEAVDNYIPLQKLYEKKLEELKEESIQKENDELNGVNQLMPNGTVKVTEMAPPVQTPTAVPTPIPPTSATSPSAKVVNDNDTKLNEETFQSTTPSPAVTVTESALSSNEKIKPPTALEEQPKSSENFDKVNAATPVILSTTPPPLNSETAVTPKQNEELLGRHIVKSQASESQSDLPQSANSDKEDKIDATVSSDKKNQENSAQFSATAKSNIHDESYKSATSVIDDIKNIPTPTGEIPTGELPQSTPSFSHTDPQNGPTAGEILKQYASDGNGKNGGIEPQIPKEVTPENVNVDLSNNNSANETKYSAPTSNSFATTITPTGNQASSTQPEILAKTEETTATTPETTPPIDVANTVSELPISGTVIQNIETSTSTLSDMINASPTTVTPTLKTDLIEDQLIPTSSVNPEILTNNDAPIANDKQHNTPTASIINNPTTLSHINIDGTKSALPSTIQNTEEIEKGDHDDAKTSDSSKYCHKDSCNSISEAMLADSLKQANSTLRPLLNAYIADLRSILPFPFCEFDNTGIIVFAFLVVIFTIHLINIALSGNGSQQDVFDKRLLHDCMTHLKAQKVALAKTRCLVEESNNKSYEREEKLKELHERVLEREHELRKVEDEKRAIVLKVRDLEQSLRKSEEKNTKLESKVLSEERRFNDKIAQLEEALRKSECENTKLRKEELSLNEKISQLEEQLSKMHSLSLKASALEELNSSENSSDRESGTKNHDISSAWSDVGSDPQCDPSAASAEQKEKERLLQYLEQLKLDLAEKRAEAKQRDSERLSLQSQCQKMLHMVEESNNKAYEKEEKLKELHERILERELELRKVEDEKREIASKVRDLEQSLRKSEEKNTKLENKMYHEERRLNDKICQLEEQLTKVSSLSPNASAMGDLMMSGNSSDREFGPRMPPHDIASLWSDIGSDSHCDPVCEPDRRRPNLSSSGNPRYRNTRKSLQTLANAADISGDLSGRGSPFELEQIWLNRNNSIKEKRNGGTFRARSRSTGRQSVPSGRQSARIVGVGPSPTSNLNALYLQK